MESFDAIILGAGACGLMCAVQAGYLGKRVLLLEKGPDAGAKIKISGGGRCNYTNLEVSTENFISENPHFGRNVVVATGGFPIPKMGATGMAFDIAKQFDIKTTKHAPALVPMVIGLQDRSWYEKLSGISVFAKVSNERISFEENILFTHWGLSGPAILQISSYWKGAESFEIDLLPNVNLKTLISKERNEQGGKLLSTLLQFYLPKKLVDAFADELPLDIKLASLSNDSVNKIHQTINHFLVKPAGDKGYEKAEVMRGGIDTNELSSKTLASKLHPNLFFGGECVDVTGWLGGYNFQWAWASGYVIAQNI